MKHLRILFVLGFVLLFGMAASAAPKESACVDCHKKVTPGIVQQHLEGKMGKKGIDCSSCHGSAHMKMDDANLAQDADTRDLRRLPRQTGGPVQGRQA